MTTTQTPAATLPGDEGQQHGPDLFDGLICHGCGERGQAWGLEFDDAGAVIGIWCHDCSEGCS